MPAPIAAGGPNAVYAAINQDVVGKVMATLTDGTEVKALGLVPGHPAAQTGFASAKEAAYAVQKTIWDTAADAYRPAEGVAILQKEGGFVAAALDDTLIGKFALPGGGEGVHALASAKLGPDVKMLISGSGEILSSDAERLGGRLLEHVRATHNFPLGNPVLNGLDDAANGAANISGGLSKNAKIALIAGGAVLGAAAIGVGIWALTRDKADAK